MAKTSVTKRELLNRWRCIEEEEENEEDISSSNHPRDHTLLNLKENWFADAFNFLISLPKENHIWCGNWDIMEPLLETFYNYSKDERHDSPLRTLWKRICLELQRCTQCISQHHQAQEMYHVEYDSETVGPLLDALRDLDEERVAQHLKALNSSIAKDDYDNAEVVSVMFEVLMFPNLLDDLSVVTEFQIFIESIDDKHEVALAGHQQYPGIYALLFSKSRRVRAIGHRLAGCMGKLRRAADLDPLQPLLKKCIAFLSTEISPSILDKSRPRVQLERIPVWLGIKALLAFLEPIAFEDGILEHYPTLFSIVLNHISDDSLEFSHAVICLRLLFELLGCKLWLKSTLSPGVMRNTLMGQCFHTRNEKSHKEIFDLFQPFLQSLEALQDGEHEEQRRNFIYFLLHQVPVSSNFSILMRKKACQIALIIIHRGYKMNPPSPPFECSHMWGPSLVSFLKDSSLHNSLRQPAFDLIQTILVSDAAALVSWLLNNNAPSSIDGIMFVDLDDEEDDELLPLPIDAEEKDISCWCEFKAQSKITSREFCGWMCVPRLWLDVLVEIDPSILPLSFSKAVFWARSRFTMVEPENSTEMEVSTRNWLSSSATELASSFGWKVPTGSDDCGERKESKNSIKVSTMHLPLVRTFKRLTAHFVVQLDQGELRKQWTWEPRMGESLILLLLDSDDKMRQVCRCILEQVSKTRGLGCGLQFLSSCAPSLSAVFLGLKHAFKLALLDSMVLNFQFFHNFFFVLCKLLKEGVPSTTVLLEKESDDMNTPKLSSQRGFLRQPVFESSPANINFDIKCQERFSCLVSEIAWPVVCKCLVEGKAFIEYKISLMACVRLLEILPIVFERLPPSIHKLRGKAGIMVDNAYDFRWLHDLMDWGNSSLEVVVRYWKQSVMSLINLFEGLCSDNSLMIIRVIRNLISHDSIKMDELVVHVSRLSISLSNEPYYSVEKVKPNKKKISLEGLEVERKHLASCIQPCLPMEADVKILNPLTMESKTDTNNVIDLSDDEFEKQKSPGGAINFHTESTRSILRKITEAPCHGGDTSVEIIANTKSPITDTFKKLKALHQSDTSSQRLNSDISRVKLPSTSVQKPKGVDTKKEENKSIGNVNVAYPSQIGAALNKSSGDIIKSSHMGQTRGDLVSETNDTTIKDVLRASGNENDSWDLALKSARRHDFELIKPNKSVPKRQLIQLNVPTNRSGNAHRLEAKVKRFMPPKLDDWYKPILEMDYFAAVGLSSISDSEKHTASKLKEVPVSFQSPEEYINIFRPLVLEEFKAQLHSSFLEMSSIEEMFVGRLSVLSVERIDDFHFVRFVHDDDNSKASRSLSDNDLVLLTKQPLRTSCHDVHMVGKVEKREKINKQRSSILSIRIYLQNGSLRLNRSRSLLLERSIWYVSQVMSITPQLREFQALSSSRDIPILGTILKPGDAKNYRELNVDISKLPQSLQKILKSSYNDSQLLAISVAIKSSRTDENFELSLVQGPPGTGKTRTIVAIVSALLASPMHKTTAKTKSLNEATKPVHDLGTNFRQKISQFAAAARAWQDAALARQLNEGAEISLKPVENSAKRRVLICAQSNAAVDELVARISSGGLYGSDGGRYKPYLVRVGNAKTVHPNSLPFFIDTLVDQRLGEEKMNKSDAMTNLCGETAMELRSKLEKLVDRIRFYEAKRANLRDENSCLKSTLEDKFPKGDIGKEMSETEIEAKLRTLNEQKKEIYKNLASTQAREKKSYEETKTLKYKLRKSILKEADIVVATLSGCGGDLYGVCSESIYSSKYGQPSENTLFDAVVIDEAAQALEPATLIPLQLLKSNGTKCIMVGDPKQLPATVLSNVASKFLYQCSMFERLQRAGHPVVMLTEQYRMHPEICRFPSLHFYDSKLLNGDQICNKAAPFHETEGLGPYVFFDVIDGQELHGKNAGALSLYNECEVDAAVELLRFFRKRYPSEFATRRIGIITPYKSQLSLLRSRFSSAFGSAATANMEFNTVDGFQGREVDILILSAVRAGDPSSSSSGNISSSIGFVADVRRMNVSLTRAMLSLWILGNARTLQTNRNWAALVNDARERNLVISSKRPYDSMFKITSRKLPSLENSDVRSRLLKDSEHERRSQRYAKQMEDTPKGTFERNNTTPLHSNKRMAVDEHDLKGNVHSERKRPRREHGSDAFNDLATGEPMSDCGNEGKELHKRKHKSGNTHKDKWEVKTDKISNPEHHVQETSASNKSLKSQVPSGSNSSMIDRSVDNIDVSGSCAKGSIHKRADTSKDLIAKRKQQREAVDALLSSSLISSKKSEPSSHSVSSRRASSSSSIANAGIQPTKPRTDRSESFKHRNKDNKFSILKTWPEK